jgi:hypothetical protein
MKICVVTCSLLVVVGCHPPKDAEVVSAVDPHATIGASFHLDLLRLPAAAPTSDAAVTALASIVSTHLATIGLLRDNKRDGTYVDVVADLPAPGFALRARISPEPDQQCRLLLEPITASADAHPVAAAPFSVHLAFDDVRRHLASLRPARQAPMSQAQFARLRAEAAVAASANRDPPITSAEYARVPRPIGDDAERPYALPPTDPSTLKPEQ